jgi:hypothetical protein
MNQLHVVALNEGVRRKKALWRPAGRSALESLVRSNQEWRNQFFHLAKRRGRKIAKVAMARKLAVHLYWMWRKGLP